MVAGQSKDITIAELWNTRGKGTGPPLMLCNFAGKSAQKEVESSLACRGVGKALTHSGLRVCHMESWFNPGSPNLNGPCWVCQQASNDFSFSGNKCCHVQLPPGRAVPNEAVAYDSGLVRKDVQLCPIACNAFSLFLAPWILKVKEQSERKNIEKRLVGWSSRHQTLSVVHIQQPP